MQTKRRFAVTSFVPTKINYFKCVPWGGVCPSLHPAVVHVVNKQHKQVCGDTGREFMVTRGGDSQTDVRWTIMYFLILGHKGGWNRHQTLHPSSLLVLRIVPRVCILTSVPLSCCSCCLDSPPQSVNVAFLLSCSSSSSYLYILRITSAAVRAPTANTATVCQVGVPKCARIPSQPPCSLIQLITCSRR